jgi:hypothetical protein
MEMIRFVSIMLCGVGLWHSGGYIYVALEAGGVIKWNIWTLAIGFFSFALAFVFFLDSISRHVQAEKMKEIIMEYKKIPSAQTQEYIPTIPHDFRSWGRSFHLPHREWIENAKLLISRDKRGL